MRTYFMLMKVAVLAVIALGVQCCTAIDDIETPGNPISANLRITLNVPRTKAPVGDEMPPFVYATVIRSLILANDFLCRSIVN